MKPFHLLALAGAAAVLSACAARPPAVPDRTQLRPPAIQSASPQRATSVAEREPAPPGAMTLDSAIETALLNHPELRADFAAFEAAALEVPQASALPDPRVSYTQFVEGVQTRTGEQQFTAGVSQMFPWFGTLRLEGNAARTRAMQVLQDYRATMLDVRTQVQRVWFRLAYEQASYALAQEEKSITEQSLEAAAALYGSGQRGRGSLMQAQTELARIENELTGYPARIAVLREELAGVLFVKDAVEVPPLDQAVYAELALPDAEVLLAEAVALRPEIDRFRLAEELADLSYELAEKDYYPDLTVGVNYVGVGDRPDVSGSMAPSDEGEDAWGVTAGLNIPIPHAGRRAAKEQALHERDEAEWRRIAAESDVEKEIRSLLPRLTSLDQQLAILRDNLIPLAGEAYAANEAGYTSGQATFLDLLEAQRTLIAVRRDLLRTRRDYLLTIAELERAVGGTLFPEELP